MTTRAVALLSGGLDSILAIRILQEQGIEVEALNFRTMFACCQETASQAAAQLGVRLSVIGAEDEYLDVIRKPQFGYGRGVNPCIDCRIYMFERSRTFMEEVGASMVVSGEVLGQRPKSQKRIDLEIIARHSGLEGQLLRPLSAKLLPATIPELDGEVDRERLYDFSGRSRKGLIALAREFGLKDHEIPSPSTGCTLTEPNFAPRVRDLIQIQPRNSAWDFELLKSGRHIRYTDDTKMVVGRNQTDNDMLEYLAAREDARVSAVMRPKNFTGPVVFVIGAADASALEFAGGLIMRYSKCSGDEPQVSVQRDGKVETRTVKEHTKALLAKTL
jgi:tRNA U34 2-thiouridine synthase MnmA/TrmU